MGMNVIPPSKKFRNISMNLQAKTMSAFLGGRAECRIRGIVPLTYCDFTSMYPTVNALLGVWKLLTAARLQIEDVTENVRVFLATVRPDDCFNPELWKDLCFFAKFRPDGDILPVRSNYDDTSDALNIGLNKLTSRKSLYYAGSDLVAAAILTGKPPIIERAIRLVAVGKQRGLRPIRIRGAIPADPEGRDFFCALVEERQLVKKGLKAGAHASDDAFLKTLANSTSYGIYAEMNRQELTKPRTITIHGIDGPFQHRTKAPEELGTFCFPPIAALIPAAARLMLALLECCVTGRGGHYASCDTDSMTIVSTETGGLIDIKSGEESPYQTEQITALSWDDVDAIVHRFESLNPYDKTIVPGSILKIEDENFSDKTRNNRPQLYGFFIASKRYALFNYSAQGKVIVRKFSEHGLGHLLNPNAPDDPSNTWIETIWHQLILEELGRPTERPQWFDRPALSQETITTARLMKPLLKKNKRMSYSERIKPMNFVLSAHVRSFGHPQGVNPRKCHLISDYTLDAKQWLRNDWTDIHSKRTVKITTTLPASPHFARVKSIGDVFDEYKTHPESKSNGPDGRPCGPHTRGVLARRHIHAAYIRLIGKEANKIEEVEDQQIEDWDEVREEYADPTNDTWSILVVPVLKLIKREELAHTTEVTPRAIQALRNGHSRPSNKTRVALIRAAGTYARARLGQNIPDDLCACAALIDSLSESSNRESAGRDNPSFNFPQDRAPVLSET
jgi:hypothetical protein